MSHRKSGLADSPLFRPVKPSSKQSKPTPETHAAPKADEIEPQPKESERDTVIPQHRDTTTPRNHETKQPRYHDTMIEEIRKAVKMYGKEGGTYRFSLEEKRFFDDTKYAYKRQNIITSGNEITRIGVNFLMADYKENGENSVLHKVLKKLND